MSDTTIIEMPGAQDATRTPFSWSAAIAGAIAATAVTFIVAALGSGIGLPFASPYSSGVSATGLTAAAAVWLVLAQALGFATGGYLAGRLRSPAFDGVVGERTFRDAAQGFMVWAIGVVAMLTVAALVGLHAVGVTAQVASGLLSGVTGNAPGQPTAAHRRATRAQPPPRRLRRLSSISSMRCFGRLLAPWRGEESQAPLLQQSERQLALSQA
jgi:hypothetical protein